MFKSSNAGGCPGVGGGERMLKVQVDRCINQSEKAVLKILLFRVAYYSFFTFTRSPDHEIQSKQIMQTLFYSL